MKIFYIHLVNRSVRLGVTPCIVKFDWIYLRREIIRFQVRVKLAEFPWLRRINFLCFYSLRKRPGHKPFILASLQVRIIKISVMVLQEVFFFNVAELRPCTGLILVPETKTRNIPDTIFAKKWPRQNKPFIILSDLSIDECGSGEKQQVNRNYQV